MISDTEAEDNLIFDTTDRFGTPVYLTSDTWNEKILRKHPHLAGEEKKVIKTLKKPDKVSEDKDFNTTRNFYREHNSIRLQPFGKLLKVSVDYEIGRIKTVYTVNDYCKEGMEIYNKDESNDG